MYITICEIDHQGKFDAWSRALKAGALGQPRGMRWGRRWEGGSGWGTHVHPWLIHVNVWQKPLQYCKVISLQWELDYKQSWAPKNGCFWTVVLEKILESPWDCKEIQPVHPRGDSWIFIGRTVADAEAPILWPPDVKNWLIGKDPDAGKHWRWEEKGKTGDEMVGWHHQLYGCEFEQTPGVGDGQGSLAWCSPWCRKELDTTERLN